MDEDDNTLLWVLLGAAAMYFLMRRTPTAAPVAPAMPRLPAPRTPGVTQNADGSLTVTEPPLPEVAVPAYYPGGNVAIPGESYGIVNPFGLPPDYFTSINQG